MIYRYSAINCAYFCEKKYELQYVLGLGEPANSLDMAFGTAVHAAINAYFEGGDAVACFTMAWGMINPGGYSKSRFDYAQLKDIGEIMLTKWVRSHAKKYVPQYIEQKVSFNINGHPFIGTPDFIGTLDGQVVLADWQTSGYRYDKRAPIIQEQLWVYAEACKQNYGFYPEALVYAVFVKDGASIQNPIVFPFDLKKHKKMLDNVTLVVSSLESRKEFVMNKSNCMRCSFVGHCYKGESNE
jgi:hypothetical protein